MLRRTTARVRSFVSNVANAARGRAPARDRRRAAPAGAAQASGTRGL